MKPAIRKWVLMTIGMIALSLGMVGIVVPLLPTTPFLLLAAACFVRSSDRLYNWLIDHKWFGSYIRHYREHRAIPRRAKVVVLVLLWGVIGYTALGVVTAWWVRVLLAAIAVGVTVHILQLKTLTQDMLTRLETTTEAD